MQKAFNFATFGPSSNVVSPNKMGKEVALLSKLFRILKYKLYKPLSSIQRYITSCLFPRGSADLIHRKYSNLAGNLDENISILE